MRKCISVYTNDFGQFSDIYEQVLNMPLSEDEEKEIEGIIISESGHVPDDYLEKMRKRNDVVVMKVKDHDITILQHGNMFEILLPEKESMVH